MLCGVYLAEFARDNWVSKAIRLVVDVLAGTPSIIVGVLGVSTAGAGGGNQSGITSTRTWGRCCLTPCCGWPTGSSICAMRCFPRDSAHGRGVVALAFMMVPIIARTTEEMLKLVPKAYREASVGVGASKAQTLFRVTLPAARAGIITGIMLAVARIAGETAPLYFTTCTANLPIVYFGKTTGLVSGFALLLVPVGLVAVVALLWSRRVAAWIGGDRRRAGGAWGAGGGVHGGAGDCLPGGAYE